ncbi:hypothetical protein ACGFYU_22430 [Streptomyces sp. NPDC048337]|uniref:hypothetical protein n=1 Tax=Streptomyces sp. NPDC048337 TaxID=3365535 RepID=UPI00371AB629
MGASLRALRALVLLAGFYLLGVFLLAVLAGIDYAAVAAGSGATAGKVVVFSVVLAIPIVRGLFMLRTPKAEPPSGVTFTVTEAQEPALWEAVHDVARKVGTGRDGCGTCWRGSCTGRTGTRRRWSSSGPSTGTSAQPRGRTRRTARPATCGRGTSACAR